MPARPEPITHPATGEAETGPVAGQTAAYSSPAETRPWPGRGAASDLLATTDATVTYAPRTRVADEPRRQDRIGPYLLEHKIGSGGQGTVWRAVQITPLVRVVALKVLRAEVAFDPIRVEQLRKEAERGGRLHSPEILPVFEFGQDGDIAYLAMPLVDGITLSEMIRQRRLRQEGQPPADRPPRQQRESIRAEPLSGHPIGHPQPDHSATTPLLSRLRRARSAHSTGRVTLRRRSRSAPQFAGNEVG
jgi:hypothetical protein